MKAWVQSLMEKLRKYEGEGTTEDQLNLNDFSNEFTNTLDPSYIIKLLLIELHRFLPLHP